MKLSDITKLTTSGVVVRDCEFNMFCLIGKEYPSDCKGISYIASTSYLDEFLSSGMQGVICTNEIAEILANKYVGGMCIADDPKTLFFQFHNKLAQINIRQMTPSCIHPTAIINSRAMIEKVGVNIGANTEIGANTVIHKGVTIGDHVIIRENCVIGTPAFYYFGSGEQRERVESTGKVIIDEGVEIHCNVTVCKGVLGGNTRIGSNSKIDSNIFIGHDVQIGNNCTIAANASFGGWTTLLNNVFVGVSSSFAPGVKVGDNAIISIGAVVTKDVPAGSHYSGNFAVEHSQFINFIKSIK